MVRLVLLCSSVIFVNKILQAVLSLAQSLKKEYEIRKGQTEFPSWHQHLLNCISLVTSSSVHMGKYRYLFIPRVFLRIQKKKGMDCVCDT